MPLKEIVKIWNEKELILDNIEFLHKKTTPVKFPLSEEDKVLIQNLIDSYKAIPCAGIAANQIGSNKSIFIGKHSYKKFFFFKLFCIFN